jgi:diaminopimelate epimerase
MSDHFSWVKGHGTRNDFLLLPDPDNRVHGDLDPALVRALCDRRGGLGADGVLRVVRCDAYGDPDAKAAAAAGAVWFMDYRNADGSLSEMCGNGIRVFARYLAHVGLVQEGNPVSIGTRDGVKTATFCPDGAIRVDMGDVRVLETVEVGVGARRWSALRVDVGNPHAVAMVGSLDDAGPLREAPEHDPADFPDGVNVEFVVRTGERSVGMRVHERGSGRPSPAAREWWPSRRRWRRSTGSTVRWSSTSACRAATWLCGCAPTAEPTWWAPRCWWRRGRGRFSDRPGRPRGRHRDDQHQGGRVRTRRHGGVVRRRRLSRSTSRPRLRRAGAGSDYRRRT